MYFIFKCIHNIIVQYAKHMKRNEKSGLMHSMYLVVQLSLSHSLGHFVMQFLKKIGSMLSQK